MIFIFIYYYNTMLLDHCLQILYLAVFLPLLHIVVRVQQNQNASKFLIKFD